MWILLDVTEPHTNDKNAFLLRDIFTEKPIFESSENLMLIEAFNIENDRTIICWSHYNPTAKTLIKDPILEVIPGRPMGEIPVTVL